MIFIRKLATVRQVVEIKPIEKADRLEVAVIDGWEVVVKKEEVHVGDLVVYFEIDSLLPEKPEFEFMRDRKFRVKTIKLRGQISQGLVMPLSILPEGNYKIGDDVTEVIGVKKYDPEGEKEAKLLQNKADKSSNRMFKFLMRYKWFRRLFVRKSKGWPDWVKKTDEERIQNMPRLFEDERNKKTKFIVTEKLDGQSATYFLERKGRKYEFGVCSRNVRLMESGDNSYWTLAKQLNIENVLKQLLKDHKTSNRVVLQGEAIGKGIQKDKYRLKDRYDFYAFNLIFEDEKVPTDKMMDILNRYGIKTVPVLDTEFTLPETIQDLVNASKGKSVIYPTKREGLVFRNYDKNISFKVINPDFLLEEE